MKRQRADWPGSMRPLHEPEEQESATDIVRSALCVEPRDGILRVFLPPIRDASAYLRLISVIEDVAAAHQQPVLLEGYEAPHHELFVRMAVTPDPGVIEVNVPPVSSWLEQVAQYETLYDEAHQLHLAPEKFDVDGSIPAPAVAVISLPVAPRQVTVRGYAGRLHWATSLVFGSIIPA